ERPTMFCLLRDKLPTRWHVYFFPVFNALRARYFRLDRAIDKRTFTDSEFMDFLHDLGFRPGAMVMVHSAFSLVKRRVPGITPVRLIKQKQKLLCHEGNVLSRTF